MTHHEFDRSELLEVLRDRPDIDLVGELVQFLYRSLIEAAVPEVIWALLSLS